jgi:murein DD-endopeptidase MepM/ murein hydrolase activator NlpD
MDDEELRKNTDMSPQGDGVNAAAGAAAPGNDAQGSEDIFASVLSPDKIAADFDKINFEIFGEDYQEEFVPDTSAQEEIPVETAADEPEETRENKKSSKRINTSDLVINVDEKAQKKAEKLEAKRRAQLKKRKEKQQRKAQSPYADEPLYKALYLLVYTFGYGVIRYVKAITLFLIDSVSKPFIIFFKALGAGKKKEQKRTVRHKVADLAKEFAGFREDSAAANKAFRMVWRDPERFRKALGVYFRYIRKNYRHFLKTAANHLLPLGAAVVLFFTVNYWQNRTFALEVTYNNLSLGSISDEAVYMEAQELIEEKLDTGAYSFDGGEGSLTDINSSLNAQYKLKLISLDELNDAETICDRVIENSADNLTNACGIYIDDSFVGAVKNEADAKTVFYNYLSPYIEEAEKEGYVVGFAENVEYKQGIYSDTGTIIIEPSSLDELIHSTKMVENEYKIQDETSVELLSLVTGVSVERLIELNPNYDFSNMKSGDRIIYETETNYLRIQKTVITTETVAVPYNTITTKDNTKYAGYSHVTRNGINGKNRITTTKTYIDGALADTSTEVTVITEPVAEIKTVGGMSYYGAMVINTTSSAGFLWPAPSCNYISSPYGYRSSGFHKGVDLCRADGGANGTSVIASRDGWVEYAGWSEIGYGYTVLINHGDGYKTRYAHMRAGSLCVAAGDYVYAGQPLGRVGSTGNSTGPHLHFEVIYYGEQLNPMNYLSR